MALIGIPILAKALTALKGGKMLAAGANAAKYAAGVPGATKQLAFKFGKDAAAQVKENIARAGIGAIRDQAAKEAGKGGIMRMAGDKQETLESSLSITLVTPRLR